MKKQYIFRVLVDQQDGAENIFRDISISATDNFETFHQAIIEAYQFKGDQMASFFMSDENWNKGQEISLMDMGQEEGIVMHRTKLEDFISERGQKMVYVYDFLNMWCFYVELMKIEETDTPTHPKVVMVYGEAPNENSKNAIEEGLNNFYEKDEDEETNEFENLFQETAFEDSDMLF